MLKLPSHSGLVITWNTTEQRPVPVIPVSTFVHDQVFSVEAAERHEIKIDWN